MNTDNINIKINNEVDINKIKLDSLCCKLSMLAYKNINQIQQSLTNDNLLKNSKNFLFYESNIDAQAFSIEYMNTLFIIYRGTESKKDILANLNFIPKKFLLPVNIEGNNSYVHSGFDNQFRSLNTTIYDTIELFINNNKNNNINIIFTGYSLGAALSSMASVYYASQYKHLSNINYFNYTFGCPRVGNFDFCLLYRSLIKNVKRYVNEKDPVCSLPLDGFFQHPTNMIFLNNKDQIINNITENNTNGCEISCNSIKYFSCNNSFCNFIKKKCNIQYDPLNQFKYHNSDFYYLKLIRNNL